MPRATSSRVVLVPVKKLKHIEGFSKTRAAWLRRKIIKEGIWNKPVALDEKHGLVMDGQHRLRKTRMPTGTADYPRPRPPRR